MTSLRAGRRCHSSLNPLHSSLYFSADLHKEFAALGLADARAVYLACRSAPLGAPGPGTVTATFYNYSHDLVARHIPRIWSVATPAAAIEARQRAVDATMRRLLGAEAIASEEMAEAAGLALRAAEGCARSGRPLYAAHADLPVPDAPHLALWHAATLLREHRGDGHIALLQAAELSGLEAIVSHSASGRGLTPEFARRSRGWSPEQWAAAEDRLRERGLLTAAGDLTSQGTDLRKELEDETDRLDAAPYGHLGEADVARLTELAGGFTATALAAGAFPTAVFGKG